MYKTHFKCDNDFRLVCHVDASYNCYSDGKSHYGYCFSLGDDNGSFYCKSAKMKMVTLSSTESEYVALCNATTEIVYLRRLLSDIGFPQNTPTPIYEDNLSCIKMLNGDFNHQTTKPIRVKYHYTKQLLKEGVIKVLYKCTDDMVADILTKALPTQSHSYLQKKLLGIKH